MAPWSMLVGFEMLFDGGPCSMILRCASVGFSLLPEGVSAFFIGADGPYLGISGCGVLRESGN